LGDEEYSAEGASIKKAQHSAASEALGHTQYKHPPPKTQRNIRLGKSTWFYLLCCVVVVFIHYYEVIILPWFVICSVHILLTGYFWSMENSFLWSLIVEYCNMQWKWSTI
jgi:hypothetical protein